MNLWGQVITRRGQILVSRTGDALCVLWVCHVCVLVCHADPPLPLHPSPRVYVPNALPCPRRQVFPHAGVVPVHTGTFWMCTRGFQRATPHRTHTPRPQRHNTTQHSNNTQHHTEKEDRQRHRDRKREPGKEDREKREDRERETRQEDKRRWKRTDTRPEKTREKMKEEMKEKMKDKIKGSREMKRDRDEKRWFFFWTMFENTQIRQMNQPKMFRRKTRSDELFLFFFERSESYRFFQLFTWFEFHFSGRWIISEGFSGGTVSNFCTRPVQAPPIWQDSFTWNILRMCVNCGQNLKRRFSGGRLWRIGKDGRIGSLSSKTPGKTSTNATKGRDFHIPSCRGHSKIVRKRQRIARTHSKARTSCRKRRSQWRTSRRTGRSSTDSMKRWRWSRERVLVYSKWLHLSSSQWTASSCLRAERRNIPDSFEIHWRDQSNKYDLGCFAGPPHERLLEYRKKQRPIRFVNWIHKIQFIEWKDTKWTYMVGAETDENTNGHPGLTICGQRYGKMSDASKRKEKQKWAIDKPMFEKDRRMRCICFNDPKDDDSRVCWNTLVESWTFRCQQQCHVKLHCAEVAGKLAALLENFQNKIRLYCWSWRIYEVKRPGRCWVRRNSFQKSGKSGKFRCQQQCFARSGKNHKEIVTPGIRKTTYACILEAVESTEKRLEETLHKGHDGYMAGKGINSLDHHNLVYGDMFLSLCSGERMGKFWEILAWQLTEVRNKNDVIAEARNESRTEHVRRWWIYVISRIRSRSPSIQSTKAGSFSEVTV